VRNHDQIGLKVIGATDIRDTLRVPLTTKIPTNRSILLRQKQDLSLNQCHGDLGFAINLRVPNIHYFIEGWSAK